MIDNKHTDLRQGIVDTCREINRNGLNQGTSGNVSHSIPGRYADHADKSSL